MTAASNFIFQIIKFCTDPNQSTATCKLGEKPTKIQLTEWISVTTQYITNDLIHENFWAENSLEKPSTQTELYPESNNSGLPVVLLVLWSWFHSDVCQEITKALNFGTQKWKTSDSFSHYDWIKWYTYCIVKFGVYAHHHVTTSLPTNMVGDELSKSPKLIDTIFMKSIISDSSKLFCIIVDPDLPEIVVKEFVELIEEKNPKISIENPPLQSLYNLFHFPVERGFSIISIADWFKWLHYLPKMRKYFTNQAFKNLAISLSRIVVMANEKSIPEETYLSYLDKIGTKTAKELNIKLDDPNDFSVSRLIVFAWLVHQFVENTKHKVVTPQDVSFMTILTPAFRITEGEPIETKIKRLVTENTPSLFPHHFVVDLIRNHFCLDHQSWVLYFTDSVHNSPKANEITVSKVISHHRPANNSSKEQKKETSSLNDKTNTPQATKFRTRMGTRKRPSISEPISDNKKQKKDQVYKKSTKEDDRKSESKDKVEPEIPNKPWVIGTELNQTTKNPSNNSKSGIDLKVKDDPPPSKMKMQKKESTEQKKTGRCSYTDCNNTNSTLLKCSYCKQPIIHHKCHSNYFSNIKTKKDDDEPTLKYCWFCSNYTPGSLRKLLPKHAFKKETDVLTKFGGGKK